MLRPFDSKRGRLWWSAPAAVIVAIWVYGVLAAGATSFPTQYSTLETLLAIRQTWPECAWPGEFGRINPRVVGVWVQFSPLFALIGWVLCLANWKLRRTRLAVVIASVLGSCSLLFVAIIAHPLRAWDILDPSPLGYLFIGTDGESYQDGAVVLQAMKLWVVLNGVLLIQTWGHRMTPGCARCGYSNEGLKGTKCPECGDSLAD